MLEGETDVLGGEKPCAIRERGREQFSRLLSLYSAVILLPCHLPAWFTLTVGTGIGKVWLCHRAQLDPLSLSASHSG